VTIDGFRATKGGTGEFAAPVQFDNQNPGTDANAVWNGYGSTGATDDDTAVRNCTLTDFEIRPDNGPNYGVHIHRDGAESITITDGSVSGCRYAAIRADSAVKAGKPRDLTDLTIAGVSCFENARGISLGKTRDGRRGRRGLQIDNVTIRTETDWLAGGSGLYASGFNEAELSNISVNGAFTNAILFDYTDDCKLNNVTARGADESALSLRNDAEATVTTARAADCNTGLEVGPSSSLAYGGVTFENVGEDVAIDGELRDWRRS
jgi:hypothetical protein